MHAVQLANYMGAHDCNKYYIASYPADVKLIVVPAR